MSGYERVDSSPNLQKRDPASPTSPKKFPESFRDRMARLASQAKAGVSQLSSPPLATNPLVSPPGPHETLPVGTGARHLGTDSRERTSADEASGPLAVPPVSDTLAPAPRPMLGRLRGKMQFSSGVFNLDDSSHPRVVGTPLHPTDTVTPVVPVPAEPQRAPQLNIPDPREPTPPEAPSLSVADSSAPSISINTADAPQDYSRTSVTPPAVPVLPDMPRLADVVRGAMGHMRPPVPNHAGPGSTSGLSVRGKAMNAWKLLSKRLDQVVRMKKHDLASAPGPTIMDSLQNDSASVWRGSMLDQQASGATDADARLHRVFQSLLPTRSQDEDAIDRSDGETWRQFFLRHGILESDIRMPVTKEFVVDDNLDVPAPVFFEREVERMELKSDYNAECQKIKPEEIRSISQIDSNLLNLLRMLLLRAQVDEDFAIQFKALGELDFVRTLYSQAIFIRMHVREYLVAQIDRFTQNEELSAAADNYPELAEIFLDVDSFCNDQITRVAQDWEMIVRVTLVEDTESLAMTVADMRKLMDLYDSCVRMCPDGFYTGRNAATLALWTQKTQLLIRTSEAMEVATDPVNLTPPIVKAIREMPRFIPHDNKVQRALWLLLLRYTVEPEYAQRKTKKGSIYDANPTFVRFMGILVKKYSKAITNGEVDEAEAAVAFPLFPDVCRQYALMHEIKEEHQQVTDYSLKELHLRLQWTTGPLGPLLQAWDRLVFSFSETHSHAETYQFIKDVKDEIDQAGCDPLSSRAAANLNALRSREEVEHYQVYATQCKKAVTAFSGGQDDTDLDVDTVIDLIEKGEGTPVTLAGACAELGELYRVCRKYANEMYRTRADMKAKEILEQMIAIRRALRAAKSTVISDETREDELLWGMFVTVSLRMYTAATVEASDTLTQEDAFDYVRAAYKVRPPLYHDNKKLIELWEVVQDSHFLKEFCEEECTQYFRDKEAAILQYHKRAFQQAQAASVDAGPDVFVGLDRIPDNERDLLLNKHPLVVQAMLALSDMYMDVRCGDEAARLLKECLDIVTFRKLQDSGVDTETIVEVWSRLYSVLVETTNPFTVLAFLDSEQARRQRLGATSDSPLMRLMGQARARIKENEIGRLHYLYQVRYREECASGKVPSRLLALNEEYASLFKQRGYTEDAVILLTASLQMLRTSLSHSPDPRYLPVWRRLVDYQRELAEKYIQLGQYRKAREALEAALENRPPVLDPEDERVSLLIGAIVHIFQVDPETAPAPSMSPVETAAFQWLYTQFRQYEIELTEKLPGIANAFDYMGSIERASQAAADGSHQWKALLAKYPHIPVISGLLGDLYFQAHHPASVSHSQHAARTMALSFAPLSKATKQQWHNTRHHFVAQRRTDDDTLDFVKREYTFMSALLPAEHPFLILLEGDMNRTHNRIVFFQKYLVAGWYYAIYIGIIVAISVSVSSFEQLIGIFNLDSVILYVIILFTEFILFAASVFVIPWPTVPISRGDRTLTLMERNRQVNNYDPVTGEDLGLCLLIPCHKSAGTLPNTMAAALRIFPPERIFICDNANSPEPIDNSREVVRRISKDYNRFHKRGPDAGEINYHWVKEGNKSLAIWWVAKHYCRSKYVLIMDDDVILPEDMYIPFHRLKDRTVATAFTICVENLHNPDGERVLLTGFQDLEYKMSGFVKMFQAHCGSTLSPHGAISMWDRKVMEEVLWNHNTMFNGEDLQMGLILQRLNRNYRLDTAGEVPIATIVPDHYWCKELTRCQCEGGKSLLRQRVTSWDPTAHRFVFEFISLLLFYWSRYAIILKPFIVYELWTIVQDYLRWPLFVWFLIRSPLALMRGLSVVVAIQLFLLLVFDRYVFRFRPDQRIPIRVVLMFPLYRFLALWFRFSAVIYNLLFYLPFIRNNLPIKDRKNLPLTPEQEQELNELALRQSQEVHALTTDVRLSDHVESLWTTIAEHLNKQYPSQSNYAAHWFLHCIIDVCRNKDAPLLPLRIMMKSESEKNEMIERTSKFFYTDVTQPTPHSFLSCLDAMCFITGRARCIGPESNRACRVVKWLWVDERVNLQTPLTSALDEYNKMCKFAVSRPQIIKFVQRVLQPAMQLMYPYLDEKRLRSQVTFFVPALRPGDDMGAPKWVLHNYPVMTPDALAEDVQPMEIDSPFMDQPDSIEGMQHYVMLVPVDSNTGSHVRSICAVMIHPTEHWILIRNALEANYQAACAVLSLLNQFEAARKLNKYEVFTLGGHRNPTSEIMRWEQVEQEAFQYFESHRSTTRTRARRQSTVSQTSQTSNLLKPGRAGGGRQRRQSFLSILRGRSFVFDTELRYSLAEHAQARSDPLKKKGSKRSILGSARFEGSEIGSAAVWDENDASVLIDTDTDIDINKASLAGFWLRPIIDIMQRPILFLDENYELIGRYAFIDPFINKIEPGERYPFLMIRVVREDTGVQYEVISFAAGAPAVNMIVDYLKNYKMLVNAGLVSAPPEPVSAQSEPEHSNVVNTTAILEKESPALAPKKFVAKITEPSMSLLSLPSTVSGRERLASNAGAHTQMLVGRPTNIDQAVQRMADRTLQSGGDEWDGSLLKRRASFASHQSVRSPRSRMSNESAGTNLLHMDSGAMAPTISVSQYQDDEDPYAAAGPRSARNRASSFLMLS